MGPLKLDATKTTRAASSRPCGAFGSRRSGIENLNVFGLPALLPLHHLELNRLPFKESAPSGAVNSERSLTLVT